jgi:hypothetical protein
VSDDILEDAQLGNGMRNPFMNAMQIIVVLFVGGAGVLAVTFTTVCCLVRQAVEKRNRQLFDAYIHSPRELETWLVRGALEHVQHVLSFDDSRS